MSYISGALIFALVVTIAIVVAGFDARETPREEASVWVTRGDSSQYARVNTQTGEIDAVRGVESPSDIVQSQTESIMFTRGNSVAWNVDGAQPEDIVEDDDDAAISTPDGTSVIESAGNWVAMLTKKGDAFVAEADAVDAGTQITPNGKHYGVSAVTVTADGDVVTFSSEHSEVRHFDATTGKFTGRTQTVEGDYTQIAVVNGDWVLYGDDQVLREGGEPVNLEIAGNAKLQASADTGDDPVIADGAGLWQIGKEITRVADADGEPAQPRAVGGQLYAAWTGATSGTMWRNGDTSELEFDDSVTDLSDANPEIRSNGAHAVLNETSTGMLWSLPSGELIPLSQWGLFEPPQEERGEIVVDDVVDPEPPVAVDDTFGIRPGQSSPLPVLLNDYDPNKRDVLTIVPESLDGLDESFGELSILPDGQTLAITPSEDAAGSTSFTYQVTDGALTSETATVTLNVVDDNTQTAPKWCPVNGCQREWPSPEMTPGGTLVLPILEGWVDPEGDPMMLKSAERVKTDDPVRVLITDEGQLAIRHTDQDAADGEIAIALTVADSNGETEERDLRVRVSSSAAIQFANAARTAQVGVAANLSPLSRVTGGSGSYTLEEATSSSGDLTVQTKGNSIDVTASKAGSWPVNVTVKDTKTETEVTGTVRVTATESAMPLTLPTLRAFVRPLTDTTIDVLASLPSSDGRAVAVTDVASSPTEGGELHADVVEHALLRISGRAPSGGFVGAVDVTVTEGNATYTGQVNVFEVADDPESVAIAVGDSATVRAGSIVDISVLENDVSPPGDRLVLHPEVVGTGTKGELAFASGRTLRYLAPKKPGTYTLTYRTYGASSPESSDTAQVQVEVLPRDGNGKPVPASVSARVAPGESTRVKVPLSGVDPDGDRVRLTGVDAPDDGQVSAEVNNGIRVSASTAAKPGTHVVNYSVRDEFGGEAEGKLRIIVTPADSGGGAPVVYSDYVRMPVGSDPVTIRPLDNDIDPANGNLSIIEVEPNLPGGKNHADYDKLAKRIKQNKSTVEVTGDDEVGTVSYRYTVQSSQTRSTSDGLIVVQTSNRVGAQAPTVEDTVLTVGDRGELANRGVDVLTDKVRWSGGDPSSLKLSLWGSAAERYEIASDSRIRGKYRADGDLVPFQLTGKDSLGNDVKTYGFLVIPPLDELRLSLVNGFNGLTVDENKAVSAKITDVVSLTSGDRLEFASNDLPTRRDQAACSVSGNTLTYTAGRGAPWADQCMMTARLVGQSAYTMIAIPVTVTPTEPIPELHSVTKTFAPGAQTQVDLTEMVNWQGGRQGDPDSLRFEVNGTQEIRGDGSRAQIDLAADAVPGTEYVAQVRAIGVTDSVAPLVIRVGQAAADTPRGGTASLRCNVGSNCSTDALGLPGEYDPFAGKRGAGLDLVGVDTGSCTPFGQLRQDGKRVSFQWADSGVAGGTCTATFTVRDAQGRTGTGTIELDARGVPRAPSGVTQVGYTGSSVVLQVAPASEQSYPAATGVVITSGGSQVGSCDSSWRCTINGLENGQKHSFVAHAVNEVGRSAGSPAVTAWAYDSPRAPRVEARQTGFSDGKGQVEVRISGSYDSRGYQVSVDGGGTRQLDGRRASDTFAMGTGDHTITAVPISQFSPPSSGANSGQAGEATVHVTGPPSNVGLTLDGSGDKVRATVTADSEAEGLDFGYFDGDGNCQLQGNSTFTIGHMDKKYETYTVQACAKNKWNVVVEGETQTVTLGGDLEAPQGMSSKLTDWLPSSGGVERVGIEISPASPSDQAKVEYSHNGGEWTPNLQSIIDSIDGALPAGTLRARQCATSGSDVCSSETSINLPTPPRLEKIDDAEIKKAEDLREFVGDPYEEDVKLTDLGGKNIEIKWETAQGNYTREYQIQE